MSKLGVECREVCHVVLFVSAAAQSVVRASDRSMPSTLKMRNIWKRTIVFQCPGCHTECLRTVVAKTKRAVLLKDVRPPVCKKKAIHSMSRRSQPVTMESKSSTLYRKGVEVPRFFCDMSDTSSD